MNTKKNTVTRDKSHYFYKIGLFLCLFLVAGSFSFSLIYHFGGETLRKKFTMESRDQSYSENKFGYFLTNTIEEKDKIRPPVLDSVQQLKAIGLKEQLYEKREGAYASQKTSLVANLSLMLVLLVLGMYVLFYKPVQLHIPIVNLDLPDKLFYVVIPMAIAYVMFQFQLTLNAAIDSRMILESMTDDLELIDGYQVDYYYSNARNLVDQGLIDTWCTYYYNVFEGGTNQGSHSKIAFLVLFGFYGVFFGLTFATCLNLIVTYAKINYNKTLSFFLLFTAVVTILTWSFGLIAWYHHSALLMSWIWLVALIAVYIWNRNGDRYVARLMDKQMQKTTPVSGEE
jgi:hypothetical protein